MANIPQVLIYQNPNGENILEVHGDNGGRKRVILPKEKSLWGEIISLELETRKILLEDKRDLEELSASLRAQRDAEILNQKIARKRLEIYGYVSVKHSIGLADRVIPAEFRSKRAQEQAKKQQEQRVFPIDLDVLEA